jgi:hypothetical protein
MTALSALFLIRFAHVKEIIDPKNLAITSTSPRGNANERTPVAGSDSIGGMYIHPLCFRAEAGLRPSLEIV